MKKLAAHAVFNTAVVLCAYLRQARREGSKMLRLPVRLAAGFTVTFACQTRFPSEGKVTFSVGPGTQVERMQAQSKCKKRMTG